jgi:hypothetical protein
MLRTLTKDNMQHCIRLLDAKETNMLAADSVDINMEPVENDVPVGQWSRMCS